MLVNSLAYDHMSILKWCHLYKWEMIVTSLTKYGLMTILWSQEFLLLCIHDIILIWSCGHTMLMISQASSPLCICDILIWSVGQWCHKHPHPFLHVTLSSYVHVTTFSQWCHKHCHFYVYMTLLTKYSHMIMFGRCCVCTMVRMLVTPLSKYD